MVPNADDSIWPTGPVPAHLRASYAEAEPHSYWFDTVGEDYRVWRGAAPGAGGAARIEAGTAPQSAAAPTRRTDGGAGPFPPSETDLAIVGGGLTGLWAAVEAKRRDPGREVVLLEAERIGFGASGRNGGFISSSLTHGLANGLARVPEEMATLERLGLENLAAIEATVETEGIDCGLALEGSLSVALTPAEAEELAPEVADLRHFGHQAELLDATATRALVDSPTFHGAVWHRSGEGLVNPVKLCLGLRDLALRLGVQVVEGARVSELAPSTETLRLRLAAPDLQPIETRRVILATAAFPGLVPAIRRRIVPVYDYVLVTEPLNAEQRDAVGWDRMVGVSDRGNQFHYYRPTDDGRILWGGYDAVYNFANGLGPAHDQRDETFARLAAHFFHTFPQLEGLRFSHRWGGAIDTCSRFSAFYGTAHDGRVAYAVGHTGLGVGASRFAAGVALDLLENRRSEATGLRFIRQKPLPFPPEPLRWAAIELTRNRLAAADTRGGKRGLWLTLLDRLGLGFDS